MIKNVFRKIEKKFPDFSSTMTYVLMWVYGRYTPV